MSLSQATTTVLLTLLALIPIGAAFAVVVAWSGLYSVAASSGHYGFVERFLAFGMRSSVETQSLFINPPQDFGSDDQVALGAGHFEGGCAPCHGAPGRRANPIVQQMLPAPPQLGPRIAGWRDRELFWIVKHGIKYAGMPAWVGRGRDDEAWAVAAFLARLPQLSAQDYLRLARGNVEMPRQPPDELIRSGPQGTSIAACARCHGDGDAAPVSALVPRLAGQKERYLLEALRAYATAERPSGIMQPVVAELSEPQLSELARFYSELTPRPPPNAEMEADALTSEGRVLAREGKQVSGLPACLSCHQPDTTGVYPLIAGQPAAYIASQLRLFRKGARSATASGAIMTAIARRLGDRDIQAVAAWLARQPQSIGLRRPGEQAVGAEGSAQ
ncbi:MAG: c-type cytochrome [Hyphomicrobiaceae bacterium]